MTPSEQQNKLAQIATLPAEELRGWWQHFRDYRQPFTGEIAALTARAQMLGLKLPSHGGPNG